jgi:hypothetical protein
MAATTTVMHVYMTTATSQPPDFPPFSNHAKSKRVYPCTTTPGFLALLVLAPRKRIRIAHAQCSLCLEPTVACRVKPSFYPAFRSYYRCTSPPCPAQPNQPQEPTSAQSSLPTRAPHRQQRLAVNGQSHPILPNQPLRATQHLNTSTVIQGSASLVVNLANPWIFQHRHLLPNAFQPRPAQPISAGAHLSLSLSLRQPCRGTPLLPLSRATQHMYPSYPHHASLTQSSAAYPRSPP